MEPGSEGLSEGAKQMSLKGYPYTTKVFMKNAEASENIPVTCKKLVLESRKHPLIIEHKMQLMMCKMDNRESHIAIFVTDNHNLHSVYKLAHEVCKRLSNPPLVIVSTVSVPRLSIR